MASKDKTQLPSGIGGLTRYFEDYDSKIQIEPAHVIILSLLVAALTLSLHYFY